MTDVKDRIRSFVLANYLPGESPENLTDTTPLQSSGILDSLAVLGLATFIKDDFGVELGVHDMTMERFDRIEEIAPNDCDEARRSDVSRITVRHAVASHRLSRSDRLAAARRVAVVEPSGRTLTYDELNRQSSALAAFSCHAASVRGTASVSSCRRAFRRSFPCSGS